jgi:UDP-N-acetylmuramate: L-alanyl-gamma-D-glutamyl-meso-diaminopimelate ligase
LGPTNDFRIVITGTTPESTAFTVNGDAFEVPMVGEFNARNAAMCVCAGRFGGLSDAAIREGLINFRGIRRRQQERGEKNGITIIDDFGHHPTAIRETLRGLRQRYTGRRLWALFEPRSNTSRRNVLQNELIEALAEADASVIAAVANPEKVAADQRLDTAKVAAAVTARGRPCWFEANTDAIVQRLKAEARSGDVIIVFSNGGFDGIHDKLLHAL